MAILFETQRLVVRRVERADVDDLLTIFGNPENVRWYRFGRPWNRAEVEEMIASYPTDDPKLICQPGVALLKPALDIVGFGGAGYYLGNRCLGETDTAELLFVFKRAFWGRGLATELARAAIVEAFSHPEVKQICATAMPANAASIRVLENSGMRRRGYLSETDRLVYWLDREPVDRLKLRS